MGLTKSLENKLHAIGLRLSLFKLDTHLNTEETLTSQFRDRILNKVGPSAQEKKNLAFYTVLGAFDSLCIYPKPEEHKILYGGTLAGVQFFSNVTCICTESNPPQKIISALNSQNCLMIVSATLRPDILPETGIFHESMQNVKNDCESVGGSLFHLRSMSWGEQIFLLSSQYINKLFESSHCLIHHLKDRTVDIHSILAFRNEFVRKLEKKNCRWKETLGSDVSLSWEVRIKRGKGTFNRLKEFIDKGYVEDYLTKGSHIQIPPSTISGSSFSLTGDTQHYFFSKTALWSNIFKYTRAVRDAFQRGLVTTELKLNLLGWEKLNCSTTPNKNSDVIDEIDRERESLVEKIALKREDCEEILNKLGDRAGKLVIQALYTVSDAAQDYPYYFVIRSLLKAAFQLKNIVLAPEPLHPFGIKEHLVYNCLQEAVSLMDAVRQRLAGVPVTRERAKTAFEAPPPSLRIHYEALEYVISSFLSNLCDLNERQFIQGQPQVVTEDNPCNELKPYIIVNINKDSPGHHFLKVLMPEHLLTDILALGALTHEALHHYVYWRLQDLFSDPHIQSICDSGNLDVVSYVKIPDILQEFIVEVFDFILTYRSDFSWYIDDVWSSYCSRLIETVRQDLKPSDAGYYVLRTLVVRLWNEVTSQEGSECNNCNNPDLRSLIRNPPELRRLIRSHFQNLNKIADSVIESHPHHGKLSSHKESIKRQFGNVLSSNKFMDMQRDLEALENVLCVLFCTIWDIKTQTRLSERIIDMQKTDYSELSDDIIQGYVFNQKLAYPHLLVHEVLRKVRHGMTANLNNAEYRRMVAKALILTLWNAWNISEVNRLKEELSKKTRDADCGCS